MSYCWVYNKERGYIASTNNYKLPDNIFITMMYNNPCKHIHQESEIENDMKLLDEMKRYD